MGRLPKDKAELLKNLERIAQIDPGSIESTKAVAFAYIINDLCPEDRTTKHVFRGRSK